MPEVHDHTVAHWSIAIWDEDDRRSPTPSIGCGLASVASHGVCAFELSADDQCGGGTIYNDNDF